MKTKEQIQEALKRLAELRSIPDPAKFQEAMDKAEALLWVLGEKKDLVGD